MGYVKTGRRAAETYLGTRPDIAQFNLTEAEIYMAGFIAHDVSNRSYPRLLERGVSYKAVRIVIDECGPLLEKAATTFSTT